MGCGASVASKYPAGPAPPRAENRIEPAAIEVATTVMTPKLPVQPMGDIDMPIQRGLSLSYGSCTIPGYDPARPRKPNQDDSLIVEQFQHESQSFFAVMDGHGTAGHDVARYAKRKLHKRLAKTLLKAGSITQAIDEAFTRTHDDLCASKVDCAISGITLTAAFLRGDELYVGNAGDCRAVIGRRKGKKGTTDYEAIDLSEYTQLDFRRLNLISRDVSERCCLWDTAVDHRPDRPDEKSRIEKCGGRVEPVKLQNNDEYVGPVRVWKGKSNVPGLNVSRSLGDIIAHSAGVSPQPEFTHTKLDKKDGFLILASDGVWEWTSSQEAVDIVAQDDDAESACERLTREAYARWERNGEGIADDTTAIVVFFDEETAEELGGEEGDGNVAALEDADDGYDD